LGYFIPEKNNELNRRVLSVSWIPDLYIYIHVYVFHKCIGPWLDESGSSC